MNTLIAVVGGVITSAFLLYIRSCMLLAEKQLAAATRLQGYLRHWNIYILDNGLFPVFNIGREWSEQDCALISKGKSNYAQESLKLKEEKKQFVAQMQERIAEGADKADFDLETIVETVRDFPKESIVIMMDFSKTYRQNLITGQTFITDDEAASLGVAVTHTAIDLKMGLVDLIDAVTMAVISVVIAPTQYDPKEKAKELGKMLWLGVVAARDSTTLLRYAQTFTTRTVLELTWRNMRWGSRLSKR